MRTLIAVGAFVLALAPAMALGQQGNPPEVECASDIWTGEYFKVQVNEGVLGEVETNVPGAIGFSLEEGIFSWTNLHTNDVFRWLFKSGRIDDIVFEGRWSQGEGSAAEVPESLSHVTFCFTEPEVPPSTTTTTSTTTPPTTTSSTTTPPATTTTEPPTTTTLPEPTTTTEPPVPTTTTTAPPSTPSTTTSPPDTTTTEPPEETTTTTTAPPVTTTTEPPPELPYTGGELELAALIGITLLALGGGALYLERSRG